MDDAPTSVFTPDEIRIAGLELRANIGVTEAERATPQRLMLSLTLRPRGGFARLEDRIERTIDYTAVRGLIVETVAGSPRRLLETLAGDLADAILTKFPACAEIEVELRKFVLLDTDYVAARLTRRQIRNPMKILSVVPILHVTDLEAVAKYYVEILGFTEDFRFGEYIGLKFGEYPLHLTDSGIFKRPIGGSTVYFVCDEVDTYFAEIKGRGAKILTEPADQPYGLRDFNTQDPAGNHVNFGCAMAQ